MGFTVAGKTPEIGLRMALGARGTTILGMFLREGLLLVSAGIAIGLGLAVAVTRVAGSRLSGLLFGVEATDPGTIGGAVVVLLVVTLVAIAFPARRASRVDPVAALRSQ